jgi:hypothetical protein
MNPQTILKGTRIENEIPLRDSNALFSLPGTDGTGKNASLPVGEELLGHHMLLLGSPGTGKTNMLRHLLRNLRVSLTERDVLVVFDPAGAYATPLLQPGDIVFADDQRASDGVGEAQWNLFLELATGERTVQDAEMLCATLFTQELRAAANPRPVEAARDLMLALIVYLCRQSDPTLRNNETLRALIDGYDAASMATILEGLPEFRSIAPNLTDAYGRTAAAALQRVARGLLQGRYSAAGTMSMRRTLRRKGGRTVFVCGDPLRSSATGAVSATLIDLCLQEILSRTEKEGNVYLLLDDVCALPPLPRLMDALRFGPARGLRLILSLSGLAELCDRYGQTGAQVILEAFGTAVAFRLRDPAARAYVQGLHGDRRATEDTQPGRPVIEDEDLLALQTGETIVAALHHSPFRFRAKIFGG